MNLICPICEKEIRKRFIDHLRKIHNFEWLEAYEMHILCIHAQNNWAWIPDEENEEKQKAIKEIKKILIKKRFLNNTTLSDFFD